jgi:transposase-like protein
MVNVERHHVHGRHLGLPPASLWFCQVAEVSTNIGYPSEMMKTSKSIDRGDRFPADVIEQAVWLSIRCPLSLRMVEDLLAARGIIINCEAVRCWAQTFGRTRASKIPRRAPQFGDRWHRGAVVISINGKGQCHVRAVDADGLWPLRA